MHTPLQDAINLLHYYITGQITADVFAEHYVNAWEQIRMEQDQAVTGQPGLPEALEELFETFSTGRIDEAEYNARWGELVNRAQGNSVPIGSQEDLLLSHLFVAADAYYGHIMTGDHYDIDEQKLLETAQYVYQAFAAG